MALIRNITLVNDYYSSSSFSETDALYNEFTSNGKRMVRLQTLGSDYRQVPGKTSQTLHIDKKAAEKLVALLTKSFDLK